MAGKKGRSGRKKLPHSLLRERLLKLETEDLPEIIDNLVLVAKGEPLICPHCKKDTGFRINIDTEACQYLIDRVLGKPKAQTDLSITHYIQLTGDQAREIYITAIEAKQSFESPPLLPPVNPPLYKEPKSDDS